MRLNLDCMSSKISTLFNFPRKKNIQVRKKGLSQFYFCFHLHLQLDSPCTSNDFVNDVWAVLLFSTHILQSVSQPNPIKWLVMNFQQVLSPGSACTTLHCPLTLQSIHVSHRSAYHLCSLVFLGHAKCLFVTLFLLLFLFLILLILFLCT